MYSGFEMRGNFKEQPFIAYGALFGAPTRLDELVPSRRDYTYAVSVPRPVPIILDVSRLLPVFWSLAA